VAASLLAFALVYVFLTILFFFFARGIVARGPDVPQGEIAGGQAYGGREKKNGVA
jgi:hypothetical protein